MSNKNLLYLALGGAVLYYLYRQSQSPAAQAAAALNTLAPVQVTGSPIPLTVNALNPLASFAQGNTPVASYYYGG